MNGKISPFPSKKKATNKSGTVRLGFVYGLEWVWGGREFCLKPAWESQLVVGGGWVDGTQTTAFSTASKWTPLFSLLPKQIQVNPNTLPPPKINIQARNSGPWGWSNPALCFPGHTKQGGGEAGPKTPQTPWHTFQWWTPGSPLLHSRQSYLYRQGLCTLV